MSLTQVNCNNNKINSALDCCESRTVRTINTKHLQQQQPQQQHSVKVSSTSAASAIDFVTGNTATCQKSAMKAALTAKMQSAALNCQTRAHRRMPMMKSYVLLPIVCIVILAQISTTSGRTLHGRKRILHSLQNRLQHHKQLMQHERDDLSPIHYSPQPQRRHHLNVRSTEMCPEERMKAALESIRNQSLNSHSTLMRQIEDFTKVRFVETVENTFHNWSKHSLSLDHPYNKSFTRQIKLDIDKCKEVNSAKKTMDDKLQEIGKIYRTFKILRSVLKEIVSEDNKREWKNTYNKEYRVIIEFLESTYDELTNNINAAYSAFMSTRNCTSLNIDHRINETIIPNYNRTAQVREWLIVVETLSFFQYLITTLNDLMQMCN